MGVVRFRRDLVQYLEIEGQCDLRSAGLPQQAVESTKRILNVHLERAVLATLDYALSAENQSFQTEDFRSIVTKLNAGKN